jgi:predicted nucleotidyltransferase
MALVDARKIARFLKQNGGTKVYGIGSLFEEEREFTDTSDIDLVVKGLPEQDFLAITARAAIMTGFDIDIIPFEGAKEYIVEHIASGGIEL